MRTTLILLAFIFNCILRSDRFYDPIPASLKIAIILVTVFAVLSDIADLQTKLQRK